MLNTNVNKFLYNHCIFTYSNNFRVCCNVITEKPDAFTMTTFKQWLIDNKYKGTIDNGGYPISGGCREDRSTMMCIGATSTTAAFNVVMVGSEGTVNQTLEAHTFLDNVSPLFHIGGATS